MDAMVKLLAKFQSRITTKIDADDLSIVLESVSSIPTVPFMGVLDVSSDVAECVWVTAVDTVSKTLTVARAHRGTTAVAHAVGVLFHHSEVALEDLGFFEVWETAGETGRPFESQLITNVLLGNYANGLKGYVDCDESGGSIGLLSGVNGEIRLPNAAGRGAYFALEGEVVVQEDSRITPWGSSAGFLYLGISGHADGVDDFDDDGRFMVIMGLTAGAGHLLSLDSHTLKCTLDLTVDKYLVMSIAENYLSHYFTVIAADGRMLSLSGLWATPGNPDGEGIVNIIARITGQTTGEANLCSAWLNFETDATILAWSHIHSDGFYDATATLGGSHLAWAKFAVMMQSDPEELFIMDLNMVGAHSEIDAIYNVNNPALALGYAATTPGTAVGSIPFFSTGGVKKYIQLFATPA